MAVPVLIAAQGAGWEANLVVALEREDHGVEVVRRCVDVVDLLAVAAAGLAQVALVEGTLRRFDADALDRLTACAIVVVAVHERDDVAAQERLHALGVRYTVPSDADAGVVAAVLVQAQAGSQPPANDRGYGDPAAASATLDVLSVMPPEPAPAPVAVGLVVAVWGPTGAPGRSTVALNLADELARLGRESLLVDADVYGGVLAPLLGLLDESPGLAAACRIASGRRLDNATLAAQCWQLSPKLRVLTGIPRADRWPELRASAVEAVLDAARAMVDFCVVDCGFCLESDEELSYDSIAPRRNGATLAVLDQADLILVIGAADPIGMQRLVRALTELREAEITAPVWVVLNRVRRSVLGGDPGSELGSALERFTGRRPAALLPEDPAAMDAALAAGKALAEIRPSSGLRLAVRDLATALALPAATTASAAPATGLGRPRVSPSRRGRTLGRHGR
jgi:Flp pilus assembly CpaE family ATPase